MAPGVGMLLVTMMLSIRFGPAAAVVTVEEKRTRTSVWFSAATPNETVCVKKPGWLVTVFHEVVPVPARPA